MEERWGSSSCHYIKWRRRRRRRRSRSRKREEGRANEFKEGMGSILDIFSLSYILSGSDRWIGGWMDG
jgi:hypothetical protein